MKTRLQTASLGAKTAGRLAVDPVSARPTLPRHPLNTSVGTRELCAWQPVRGVTWVQTRSPQFAGKLSRRSDSRLVMRGVYGGYLRTFEFRHSLAWAQKLMARYTQDQTVTNAVIKLPSSVVVRPTSKTGSRQGDK
jgi:hypothetical protein